jgi:hypothetical protein
MKLFRRNREVQRFFMSITKGDLDYTYLGYNIIAIQKPLMEIPSPIIDVRKSTSVIDSTYCINKTTVSSGSIDADHISEIYRLSAKIVIHFTPVFNS